MDDWEVPPFQETSISLATKSWWIHVLGMFGEVREDSWAGESSEIIKSLAGEDTVRWWFFSWGTAWTSPIDFGKGRRIYPPKGKPQVLWPLVGKAEDPYWDSRKAWHTTQILPSHYTWHVNSTRWPLSTMSPYINVPPRVPSMMIQHTQYGCAWNPGNRVIIPIYTCWSFWLDSEHDCQTRGFFFAFSIRSLFQTNPTIILYLMYTLVFIYTYVSMYTYVNIYLVCNYINIYIYIYHYIYIYIYICNMYIYIYINIYVYIYIYCVQVYTAYL